MERTQKKTLLLKSKRLRVLFDLPDKSIENKKISKNPTRRA